MPPQPTAASATAGGFRSNRLARLFTTTIGRKLIAAATAAVLVGFLVAHLLGNLLLFKGPDALNSYAVWAKTNPLIWPLRIFLLGSLMLHIYATITLARDNRRARAVRYEKWVPGRSTIASRSMRISGVIVLAYVVFHLLHFTFGVVDVADTHFVEPGGRPDVYTRMVSAFSHPTIALGYMVAIGLLAMHLWHGIASAFQTVGVHRASYSRIVKTVAFLLLAFLVLGNWLLPLSVLLGKVTLVGGV